MKALQTTTVDAIALL